MEKFIIKIGKKLLFFDKEEIDRVEADNNYIRVFVNDRSFVLRNTLRAIEEKLDKDLFVRVNRSTIINVDRIRELIEMGNNDYEIILNDQKSVKWNRYYKKNLNKFLRL